ncbi:MAG: HDOD domain-containing protein, partial [Dethiobacteria bacterium]|nr:HDOD domain-containing protein [Dethiobacteria bacterium]
NIIASRDKSKRTSGFSSSKELWRHSISVSALAKRIAMLEQADICLINDALVSGLLHDLGKLIVCNIPQYQQLFLTSKTGNSCFSYKDEYSIANTSHAEAGGYLLGLWSLPQSVIDAVAFHHQPLGLNEASFSALTATHLANSIVNHNNLLAQGEDSDILEIMEQEYLSCIELKHDLSYYIALAGA